MALILLASCALLTSCKHKEQIHVYQTDSGATNSTGFNFPEEALGLQKTGICFSGGGTRAMTCAIGQMKGLDSIGIWPHVGYISSVSGGSWASSIFTYYQTGGDGPQNDAELLGQAHAPGDLILDSLKTISKKFMGHAVTRDFLGRMLVLIAEDDDSKGIIENPDKVWIDAVGWTYLKPFGLYENGNKYFSLNDSSVNEIVNRPGTNLKPDDFITVHNKAGDAPRPYLVMNSSILMPSSQVVIKNPEPMAVFNYSPLGVGSAQALDVEYDSDFGDRKFDIGGGFIDPFAMGSEAPSDLPEACDPAVQGATCATAKIPEKKFELVDAVGTSSAAFSASIAASLLEVAASDIVFSGNPIPQQPYWPVRTDEVVAARDFRFADGGNLENFGLITMMQRDVRKLVVFINTNSPIDSTFVPGPGNPPQDTTIDWGLYTLFDGYTYKNQYQNNVFQRDDFDTVFNGLNAAFKAGETVMFRHQLTTIENDWWGIPANQTYDILWVYNETVANWESQLDSTLQAEINAGKDGLFPNFPQYALMFEDFPFLVKYTPEMTNLLYELQAWNVYSNKEVFDFIKED